MGKIQQLPQHVISRIAAGEVIERPAYAVKELIENSIDAGADDISIHIEDAGLKKIVVTDNGEGLDRDDLFEAVKPHTTSKIIEDLVGIKTLGFRGEALSSIASVSDMVLQSRTEDSPGGFQVELHKGNITSSSPVGMPVGTVVSVNNLFYIVPARKKFLKSKRTEFRHIVDIVAHFALAHPHIRFMLTHNKRTVLDLPKGDFSQRLQRLLGPRGIDHMLTLGTELGYVQIEGYISRPQLSTRLASKQFIFINNRFVTDRLISSAVKESYGNLLESTTYPVFVLFLQLPYELVDVNVHPRKEQVSFVQKDMVYESVKKAVQSTLSAHNLTFYNLSFGASRAGTTSSYAAQILRESAEPWSVKDEKLILKTDDIHQLHNTYLVIQSQNGFVMVDQHAAHERILYEQYREEFQKQKKKMKATKLKKPLLVKLSVSEQEILDEYKDFFQSLGFLFNKSKDSFSLTHVPLLFQDRDMENLLSELAEEISAGRKPDVDSFSDTMLSFLSCRSAVMAGDKLTKDEAKKLIEKLEKTPHNVTCPHGRPTKIEVPITEVDRMFMR